MSKKNPLNHQIDNLIRQVIDPLDQVSRIDPDYIAREVDKRLDPQDLSPALKTHSSIDNLKGRTRKMLANLFDPKKRAENFVDGAQIELFTGLQSRYPAQRKDESGRAHRYYIVLDDLDAQELKINYLRMGAASISLGKHAHALEAYAIGKFPELGEENEYA